MKNAYQKLHVLYILSFLCYVISFILVIKAPDVGNFLIQLELPNKLINVIGLIFICAFLIVGMLLGIKSNRAKETWFSKLLIALGPGIILAYFFLFAFLP